MLALVPARPVGAEDPSGDEGPDQAFAPISPFSSWGDFLDQQYADLLPAPGTADERGAAAAALAHGQATPGGMVAGIRASAENRANVDPVVRLYRAFFLRVPDVGGLHHWIGVRRSGSTLGRIADSF
ncbi:MAG: hypothetical protein ACTHN0_17800, partial [Aquihabitans sp.]